MNEAWQLIGFVAALGCTGWLAHAVAARLALKKLQKVASHRLNLEQCWLLIGQVPDALLASDTRKALGKILTHHLARSRRSGTNESAQELRIARLVGHNPTAVDNSRPSDNLAQTLRQLIDLIDSAAAQDLLTVREHVRAHDPLYHTLLDVEQALAQRQAQIDELLYLPFGRRASAKT